MSQWFEDESFWIDMYPFLFPRKRMEEADFEIEKLLNLIEFKGDSVLDLCCGPGRHAISLAKRGFSVTAVDRTSFFLEKGRQRAKSEKLDIEFVLQDMLSFKRPESFDLALNLWTSFGFFDRKEDDLIVLDNIYQSLKSGGVCLIDLFGKETLAEDFQPTTSDELADGTILVQRHKIFDNWTRIRNEWILIKNGIAKSYTFHHTLYSGQELMDRLERVGFTDIRLFGDYEGTEYGPDARRLIAAARKE
ncbi:MAG: class I SAM-dependent methyltransferase [Candidatus Adiutricales bacterium]|jgi:SAM-dependent methyltransferase